MTIANIASPGSQNHAQLARFTDRSFRQQCWNQLLINDKNGRLVNESSGSLRYDDHVSMLDDVVEARKFLPTVYNSLASIPGVGVQTSIYQTLVGYQNLNEFEAETSMNASNRKNNRTDYEYEWTPQPIYHTDFEIPWRQEGFAYKQGDGTAEATMQVALERDRTLMLGNDNIQVRFNGVDAQLYGLTNHPGTLSLAGGISDWANDNNLTSIVSEAIGLVDRLYRDRRAAQIPGSVRMYVANDVYTKLENDYSEQKGDRSIMERINAITAIGGVMPSQWLPDGAVLLVEATPMTLRIPRASDITVAPWTKRDPMESLKFTVFASSTLQVRQDRNNLTGLLYATKS